MAQFEASAQQITVQQTSATNRSNVVQIQNSHANVNKVISAGSLTNSVTNVIQVAPQLSPVSVTQSGNRNILRAMQRGDATSITVGQTGGTNQSVIRQSGK
jgi:Fe2+ transport system protein FeoA